jgi:hypothetical protein
MTAGGIKERNLHTTLQTKVNTVGADPFRGFFRDWYVDSVNGDSGYDGKSWDAPLNNITNAMTAAALDAGDVRIKAPRIYVAPGDYDEGAVIDMNITNMQIIGSNTHPNNHATMLYSSSATHDLIEIGAHNVKVYNMGLVQTKARDCIQLGDAASETWWKVHIAGCKFDLWGTGLYGVTAFDDTCDMPDIVIEGNLFRSFATAGVKMRYTRGMCNFNHIYVPASKIGIDYQNTGGNRADNSLLGNWIIGANSGDTGIKLPATEPTDGSVLVALNVITNCQTLVTKGKGDAGLVNNWSYIDGTAPGQADPT